MDYETRILTEIDDVDSKVSESDLRELCGEYEVDRSCGDNGRWTRTVRSIVQLGDRTFEIIWEQGLTESQDNYYPSQPVEVKLNTYEKTITVREWVKIDG